MWKLLLVVAIAVVDVPAADACSCSEPRARVVGAASGKLVIPRNGQIRVMWWGEVQVEETSFALVPDTKTGPPIALERKVFTTGAQRWAVLSPKSPLGAHATYHLMASETKGGKPSALAEVTTTSEVDDAAPTWKGITGAYFLKYEPQCCMCRTGGPEIDLDLEGASDEATAADELVYGVWADAGTFDPKAPLLALTTAYQGHLAIGSLSICSAQNFEVPENVKSIKLYVAPIDLAGNIGTPSPVGVDLTKPLKQRPIVLPRPAK